MLVRLPAIRTCCFLAPSPFKAACFLPPGPEQKTPENWSEAVKRLKQRYLKVRQ
jgi:hypothetical protein